MIRADAYWRSTAIRGIAFPEAQYMRSVTETLQYKDIPIIALRYLRCVANCSGVTAVGGPNGARTGLRAKKPDQYIAKVYC